MMIFTVLILFMNEALAAENIVSGIGTYTMSDYETTSVAEERALDYAKLNASEQMGVIVDNYVKIKNGYIDKDNIKFIYSSSFDIIDKNTVYENINDNEIKITVYLKAKFNSDLLDNILSKNQNELKKIIQQQKELENEISIQNKKIIEFKNKIKTLGKNIDIQQVKNENMLHEREYLAIKALADGYNAMSNGRLVEIALEKFNTAIELNPKLAQAYVARAGVLIDDRQEYDKGIEALNKALILNPNLSTAYVYRAFAYGEKNMDVQEIADLNKAIELDANNEQALSNRGFYYQMHGMYELAEKDYSKAIEIAPKYIMSYLNRGRMYFYRGQYKLAISDLTAVIENSDNFKKGTGLDYKTAALHDRAVAYRNIGDDSAAMCDFSAAIEYDHDDLFSYCDRGCLYLDIKNFELAENDLNKTVALCQLSYSKPNRKINEIKDKQALAYKVLSDVCILRDNDYEKAIQYLNKAIEIKATKENLDDLYVGRGFYHAALRHINEAYSDFANALSINPNNEYAKKMYNEIYSYIH